MRSTKIGTIALVLQPGEPGQIPALVEQLSDDQEIGLLEEAIRAGETQPLECIYALRTRQAQEDEEFGNYVEELLSQPFLRPEIQEHGVQWLRSKIRIEEFQKCEREATQVIAQYALKVFQENPDRTDFLLAGPVAKVRVRIFVLGDKGSAARSAA